jgi:hypothetical protein
MFETSTSFLLFDAFRVPYEQTAGAESPLAGCAWLRAGAEQRLYWPERPGGEPVALRLEGAPVFAAVVGDAEARTLLGDAWEAWLPLTAEDGSRAASVWRGPDGSVFLPFSPDEAIVTLLSERYDAILTPAASRGLKATAMRTYYLVRPALPRRLQIAMRRAFSRIQARRAFPRWPSETGLHDLQQLLLRLAAQVAGEPVPTIAPWPGGKRWAFVLTHDVELQPGFDNMHLLADVERKTGYRSSWNLVPRRYEIDDTVVHALAEDGFEIGVHGLYHDGRDLESEEKLRERLPEMKAAAGRWHAVGFRSPATHRRWELMPLLGFDYDSSSPDSDPFEPYGGGCCSWLPFFNEELVELPITLVQDHTLFVILKRADESAWVEKTEFLRERGGMSLLITHPDYMLDRGRLDCYERLLARFAGDESMWHALPRDVSAWWRRRAASRPVRRDGTWAIDGPAAGDGTVELVAQAA